MSSNITRTGTGLFNQRDEIFNPEKEKPFSFACRDCFNKRVAFLKYYPEVIVLSSEDMGEREAMPAVKEEDRDWLLKLVCDKLSQLKGFKPVKRIDIEKPKMNGEEVKQNEENGELGKRKKSASKESNCALASRLKILSEDLLNVDVIAGVFMREDLYDFLCKCSKCESLYDVADPNKGLFTDSYFQDLNYEEALAQTNELEQEMPEMNTDPSEDFLNYMSARFKERTGREISHAETLVMSESFVKLKEQLANAITSSGKTEITEEDMRDFLSRLKPPGRSAK